MKFFIKHVCGKEAELSHTAGNNEYTFGYYHCPHCNITFRKVEFP